MGRHYNRTKKQGGQAWSAGKPLPQNVEGSGSTSDRLAKDYGVSDMTIQRAGKFAAAVETLKAVDPDIESKGRPGNILLKMRMTFPASFAWSAPRIVPEPPADAADATADASVFGSVRPRVRP